jgi:hypothetical protein
MRVAITAERERTDIARIVRTTRMEFGAALGFEERRTRTRMELGVRGPCEALTVFTSGLTRLTGYRRGAVDADAADPLQTRSTQNAIRRVAEIVESRRFSGRTIDCTAPPLKMIAAVAGLHALAVVDGLLRTTLAVGEANFACRADFGALTFAHVLLWAAPPAREAGFTLRACPHALSLVEVSLGTALPIG